MAFYYVKTGGTASGDAGRYATQQTGSFATLGAANYYATMAAAMAATTPPVGGDFICISDATSAEGTTTTWNGPTSGAALRVISVADANMDTLAVADNPQFYAGDELFNGRWYFNGVWIKSDDDNGAGTSANSLLIFESCNLEVTGTGDNMVSAISDGSYVLLQDCTLRGIAGSQILLNGAATIEMRNCNTVGVTDQLVNGGFINGGGRLIADGCNFASLNGGTIINNVGSDAAADDSIDVQLRGCLMSPSLTAFHNENFASPDKRLAIYNSSSSTTAVEYQFYIHSYGGVAQDDTTIYRNESTAFPSGTKVSAKVVTNTEASLSVPFWFDLMAIFANFSVNDIVRLRLVSTASLTDIDVWAQLIYPDGTNKNIYSRITTKNSNPFAASGTALTTDSGSDWRNGGSALTGYNEYQIDLDTSGDPGADSPTGVRIFVAKASITVYVDTTLEMVA